MDTSSFVKLFVQEPGSANIAQFVSRRRTEGIVVAGLTRVEVRSVVARLRHAGYLSEASADAVIAASDQAIRTFEEVPLGPGVLSRAGILATRWKLRSLDAIQLACALETRSTASEPAIFITSDHKLAAAAALEGFNTWDPAGAAPAP